MDPEILSQQWHGCFIGNQKGNNQYAFPSPVIIGALIKPITSFLRAIVITKKTISRNVTKSELEVLKMIVNGYSTNEIADLLFISEHTAITDRKRPIEKFKARNRAQMVKSACQVYAFD